jgi:hypothetical protein
VIRSSLAAAALLSAALLTACASTTNGSPSAVPVTEPAAPSSPSSVPRATLPASTSAPSTPAAPTTPDSSTHPVPATPLRTKVVTASDGTVYAVSIWAEQESGNCAAHAYGQVAQFLAGHACTGIHQVLATTAINGRAVGFEENSVGFSGSMQTAYKNAGDFTTLVSTDGTGNLNDLLREGYRLPAGPDQVPSPDAFKALGQDNGVVVTDAWYLVGPTRDNAPQLEKMAEDLFLQI